MAGTSFEIALSAFAGPDDVITPVLAREEAIRQELGFRGAQNYRFGVVDALFFGVTEILLHPSRKKLKKLTAFTWPNKFFHHIPAADAKKRIGSRIWNEYQKISIIRNPFDRAVSHYFWNIRNKEEKPDFESWCINYSKYLDHNNRIYYIDSENVIDIYIRYEKFKSDLKSLEKNIHSLSGLYDIFENIRIKSNTRPKKSISTKDMFKMAPKACELIEQKCKKDIDAFGYSIN